MLQRTRQSLRPRDALLALGVAALGSGLVLLIAGLTSHGEPIVSAAPIVLSAADDRLDTLLAADLGMRLGTKRVGGQNRISCRAGSSALPPASTSTEPAEPYSGRDPARTDRHHVGAIAVPDDRRTFLLRATAHVHRRAYVDISLYPQAPLEGVLPEPPPMARFGGVGGAQRVTSSPPLSGSSTPCN